MKRTVDYTVENNDHKSVYAAFDLNRERAQSISHAYRYRHLPNRARINDLRETLNLPHPVVKEDGMTNGKRKGTVHTI